MLPTHLLTKQNRLLIMIRRYNTECAFIPFNKNKQLVTNLIWKKKLLTLFTVYLARYGTRSKQDNTLKKELITNKFMTEQSEQAPRKQNPYIWLQQYQNHSHWTKHITKTNSRNETHINNLNTWIVSNQLQLFYLWLSEWHDQKLTAYTNTAWDNVSKEYKFI